MTKENTASSFACWQQIETVPDADLGFKAAAELRAMCLHALNVALQHPVGPAVSQSALDAWLMKNEAVHAQKQNAGRVYGGQFAHVTPDAPKPVVLSLLAESLPTRRRDVVSDFLNAKWRQWIRRDKVHYAPDFAPCFLPALVAMALADGAFQLDVQKLVKRHLETRVILFPEGDAKVTVSTVSLVLLLAAHLKAQQRSDHLVESISSFAKLEAKQPGWAGFWDVWLLSQATRAELPSGAWAWLSFPSLDPLRHGENAQEEDELWMMSSNWMQDVPAFAPSLMAGTL